MVILQEYAWQNRKNMLGLVTQHDPSVTWICFVGASSGFMQMLFWGNFSPKLGAIICTGHRPIFNRKCNSVSAVKFPASLIYINSSSKQRPSVPGFNGPPWYYARWSDLNFSESTSTFSRNNHGSGTCLFFWKGNYINYCWSKPTFHWTMIMRGRVMQAPPTN